MPLVDVLEQLRSEGLPLAYSTELVGESLLVLEPPEALDPLRMLEEILAPHGLGLRLLAGVHVVVRRAGANAADPVPGSKPATASSDETPATRKNRFLPIRFGMGGPASKAGTGNISETGLFIRTDQTVAPGTRVRLILDLAEAPLPLLGEVRWRRTERTEQGVAGMGIQLMEPPRPYVQFVRSLV